MLLGKSIPLAIFLLGVGLYILLPTLDEVIFHPVFGLFLSQTLDVPFTHGVGISVVIYRGIGVICLLGALLIGGKPIYQKLKTRFKKDNSRRDTAPPR